MRVRVVVTKAFETDARAIEARLQSFLSEYRKKKLAARRAGFDEEKTDVPAAAWEDDGEPIGEFAEGADKDCALTHHDTFKIRVRTRRLLQLRLTAAGLSHLKDAEIEKLKPLLRGVKAVMPGAEHWADELAATLHEEFPWMAPATEAVWHELRSVALDGRPIRISPIILCGPAGIGKSVWVRRLADMLELPWSEIDASKGNGTFVLAGTERGWNTAQPGRPVETLITRNIANPLMIVHEICKANVAYSNKGQRHSFHDALLAMIEPATARHWECPFYRVPFDPSHLSWIMTANTLSTLPGPLRSRCAIVHLPDLTTSQLVDFAEREGSTRGLSPEGVSAIAEAIHRLRATGEWRVSLRDVNRMLDRGVALERRQRLH